ncbi:MAG: RNA-binding protein, partial [Asgard group archaeon]|nr:RNA-binding protein [Asgard group archaeon]
MPIFIENRQLVTPGEIIAEGKFGIGSNVYRKEKQVVSQVIGLVNIYDNKISVVPLKGQYSPRVGDMVIGIVEEVSLNSWLVDISSPYPGVMKTSTAIKKRFDPVRDRARDFFDVGDVVAAKILSFDRTRDPMLTLWENNRYGAGFLGKLSGGRIIEV